MRITEMESFSRNGERGDWRKDWSLILQVLGVNKLFFFLMIFVYHIETNNHPIMTKVGICSAIVEN